MADLHEAPAIEVSVTVCDGDTEQTYSSSVSPPPSVSGSSSRVPITCEYNDVKTVSVRVHMDGWEVWRGCLEDVVDEEEFSYGASTATDKYRHTINGRLLVRNKLDSNDNNNKVASATQSGCLLSVDIVEWSPSAPERIDRFPDCIGFIDESELFDDQREALRAGNVVYGLYDDLGCTYLVRVYGHQSPYRLSCLAKRLIMNDEEEEALETLCRVLTQQGSRPGALLDTEVWPGGDYALCLHEQALQKRPHFVHCQYHWEHELMLGRVNLEKTRAAAEFLLQIKQNRS